MNSKKNQHNLTAEKKKAKHNKGKVSQDLSVEEELLPNNAVAAGSQLSSYRQGSEVGRKAVFSQTIAVSPTAEHSQQTSLAHPKVTNAHSGTQEATSPAGKKVAQQS